MSRLYLIRHGESVWNATRRLRGQADPDLSPRGESQARELATVLPPQLPRDAICSDLQRASRTAALLGLDAQPDRRWREIGVGEWEGQDTDDLRTRDPACWRAWRAGDFTPRYSVQLQ
ncbi:histidine phosphatase family protein [Sphingomonas sp. UV9]|uniref:histidine phosphatase family protein n=1 Tax=Sphingomonas sp. UV9 TaxID=1851410 RepID=UPI0023EA4D4B|nr:histidine phosphatase family protein [Sphingomonas sp. UV9]